MALQLVLGGSGSGKSTHVFEQVIEQSLKEEKRNFFILVPDQFTMQTQMDLVTRHPRGGIMNIDVLSFGRLAYRIMEERGTDRVPVLDDTGKSLVLRKVADKIKDELPVLGSHLKKQGYIHQVKSALSEFMQYGVGEKELDEMLKLSEKRGSLYGKLKDLKVLHKAFREYLTNRFITTEGTFERLARQLEDSELIADSIVVLDGFTGFTPVQNLVIEQLLKRAHKVIVTLTLEEEEKNNRGQLFSLSIKTSNGLERLARQAGIEVLPPVRIDSSRGRFRGEEALAHLEKHLFSIPVKTYKEETDSIRISEADTMEEEVRGVCRQIRALLREGYCYRDIAVISGDLEGYKSHIEELFEQYSLPFFLDRTRGITLNPFIEYIRSALQVITTYYSYEAMFHYLRSGMVEIGREETDRLENYCLAYGIKGKKAWNNLFVRVSSPENGGVKLEELNRIRARIVEELKVFTPGKRTVRRLVEELYSFLTANRCQEKLKAYEEWFRKKGDKSKEKEYAQIYRLVIDLLDQIVSLLGEEEMTWDEFARILDAGFGEIQVGIIPQVVDKIVVGDMERTRLSPVKALFFLGMNEGKIPRPTDKGGILSDLDREFLEGCGQELAPTPRNQLFIQRFYLYLNVTRPSRGLFLSYAKRTDEGKSVKPSYFIEVLKGMYPHLTVNRMEEFGKLPNTTQESRLISADLINRYRNGRTGEKENHMLLNILTLLQKEYPQKPWVEDLLDGGFFTYEGDRISKETARLLYKSVVMSSVSRLEKMAACAYSHFLRYGLELRPRQEYGFEAVDLGNLYHGVLELFSAKLTEQNHTWTSFCEEEGRKLLQEALESYAIGYGNTVLYSSAANAYGLKKMEEILWRTVRTLKHQLKAGKFRPGKFELSFSALEDLESVTIRLSGEEKLRLGGRIDRVDTYEENDRIYVKVMDYKSGNRQFQLAAFYHGLQLQLVVYLHAAMELEKRNHPDKEVIPGAFVYYHIADPLVEMQEGMDEEEIERQIQHKLRVTGIVNSDPAVLEGLDDSQKGRSQVIPVEYKADGSLSSRSSVMDTEHIQLLLDYSRKKAGELGERIIAGEVTMNPGKTNQTDACTYCEFRQVCAFEEKIPGFEKRELGEESEEELWSRIRHKLEENPVEQK